MTEEGRCDVPEAAIQHLSTADPVMGAIIDRVGRLDFRVERDLWRSLVGSIVGQQLSVAAARTIRGRVASLGSADFPTPGEISACDDKTLRGCGLSRGKMSYIRDIAGAFASGEIEPEVIASLPDEEVIETLTSLRGVGRWTAEMVLTFSLGREDVLAVDDLGIRAAVQTAYGLAERPDRKTLREIGQVWSPWRSYASLYLWRSLDAENAPIVD